MFPIDHVYEFFVGVMLTILTLKKLAVNRTKARSPITSAAVVNGSNKNKKSCNQR